MRKTFFYQIVAVAAMFGALSANAEILLMKNGDKLTGEIVKTGSSQYIVKSDFGMVAVPKNLVESIAASAEKADRKNPQTDSEADKKADASKTAAAEDATLEKQTDSLIESYKAFLKDTLPLDWQFKISGGLEYRSTSSSIYSVYAAFDARREWVLDTFAATAYYNYTTQTDSLGVKDKTIDNYGVNTTFRHNFDKSTHWYLQNLAAYKRDTVKGIRDQVDEALTVGYRFDFPKHDLTIDIAPGPAVRYIQADNYDTHWVAMGVITEDLNWKLGRFFTFNENIYAGFNFQHTEQQFLYLKLALLMHVTDVMDIALRYHYNYDSINSATADKVEQRLLLTFEFPFNWVY